MLGRLLLTPFSIRSFFHISEPKDLRAGEPPNAEVVVLSPEVEGTVVSDALTQSFEAVLTLAPEVLTRSTPVRRTEHLRYQRSEGLVPPHGRVVSLVKPQRTLCDFTVNAAFGSVHLFF